MSAGIALVRRRIALEQKAFWRNREAAFFAVLLPIALLLILAQLDQHNHLSTSGQAYDQGLVPGVLSFGLIATCYVNLAITLTRLREEGVLKRLRATPLSPTSYLAGQIGSTLTATLVMTLTLVTTGALLYSARLGLAPALAFVAAVALGTTCLCALAFAVTIAVHTFSAVAPVTNASSLPLVLISSAFSPNQFYAHSWLHTAAGYLPVQALAHALQSPYLTPGRPISAKDFIVLAVWTIGAAAIARRRFRWTPSTT